MNARLSCADNVNDDELDEEFDTFPSSHPPDIVGMRFDSMTSIAGRIQIVVGDLATQGEMLQSLLSLRDPRATALYVIFCLIASIVLYVTPFQVPRILCTETSKLPSAPLNFFKRLPAKADCMLISCIFLLLSLSACVLFTVSRIDENDGKNVSGSLQV
ncbi:FT-interacting protein 3-like [Solanum dulcamara]|uniref:FT-interacting protein 3-like n=1 Tax=Solanum dulcamara TaxID=45834 RepID=UPI002486C008|nr:FT-interacting protein 3-like [Solanum dulcamara]